MGRQGAVLTGIRTVAQTGSTNADLLALAAAGAEEGLWLRAERQSAGRGRQERAWTSPPGNLYASTIVRLRPTDPAAPGLALVAAVALHEVVEAFARPGERLRIKWPNDLLIDGAKLSGILLERAGDAVVIGFGVNLASHPDLPDRRTTSLAAQGMAVTPEDFAAELASAFARWLARWRGEGLAPVRAAWLAAAHPIGTPLRLTDLGEALFDGLTGDGSLIVRMADGRREIVHAGDVFLI